MKKIGLFGLTFDSGNMGCNALSYSFLDIIKEYAQTSVEVIVFDSNRNVEKLSNKHISCRSHEYSCKSIKSMIRLYKKVKTCDIIFDFTAGDSFSDIYGIKRMLRISFIKILIIFSKIPLFLGPQTYGPYNSRLSKLLARYIIKKSFYVCSRDSLSANLIKKLCRKDIDIFTDIAFALKYTKKNPGDNRNALKVGINVSALLWNGGYTGNNEFKLTLNYRNYITDLLLALNNNSKYSIYLIPHVISSYYGSVEDDYAICESLADKHSFTILAPRFKNPIEAKNYISDMDIFIGSRMHATIAAFSSGVVTIPVSYSQKFNGLYSTIGYNFIIDALKLTSHDALKRTLNYIDKKNELSKIQGESMIVVEKTLRQFYLKCSHLFLYG